VKNKNILICFGLPLFDHRVNQVSIYLDSLYVLRLQLQEP